MGNVLNGLEPSKVFKYFEEISQVPRDSKKEKKISDYLVNFAKEHNFEYIQDSALNVIIKKPASRGYENAPTVILQGHMDMVCEKNKDTVHDFDKDPLKLRVVGDMIYATGTTLGGDNGIAVAYGLALLDSDDIAHPALEVLFTTDEENAMGGAAVVDSKHFKGRILINIDHEVEGQLLVSCSGGVDTQTNMPIHWEKPVNGLTPVSIRIRGLQGGHSGMSIHLGRGNANKMMGRLLLDLKDKIGYSLASLSGGVKDNAIPRESDALVLIDKDRLGVLKERVELWQEIFKNELLASDPDIRIEVEVVDEKVERVFSAGTLNKALELLFLLPNGINTLSAAIEGLVESSNNVGVIKIENDELIYMNVVRSCVGSLKKLIVDEQKMLARLYGAKYITALSYPEWQYDPDSKIRRVFESVYLEMYGKEIKTEAIHAGIECGLLKEKFGELDMVAFGPDIFNVHTPEEHLSISSAKRCWEYLLEVLKAIK